MTGHWNATNAALFESVLHRHVNDPSMTVVVGTHRGVKPVTHYYDPATGRNVMVDPAGELESAWQLSGVQVAYLLTTGNVQ